MSVTSNVTNKLFALLIFIVSSVYKSQFSITMYIDMLCSMERELLMLYIVKV